MPHDCQLWKWLAAALAAVLLCTAGGCVQRTVVTWTPASAVSNRQSTAGTDHMSVPAVGTSTTHGGTRTAMPSGKTTARVTKRSASTRTRKPTSTRPARTTKATIPSAYIGQYLPPLSQLLYCTATAPVDIRNGRFTVTIPAGVTYPRDIATVVETTMRRLEEVTGLSFFPGSGCPPVTVTVNLDDWGYADADAQGVTLVPMYLAFDGGNGLGVLLELLANTLLQRNMTLDCPFLSEGFVLTAVEALETDLPKPILSSIAATYSDYPEEAAMIAGGETYLLHADVGEASRSGYRFCRYLQAVYGTHAPAELVRSLAAADGGSAVSSSEAAAIVKSQYGASVFQEFITWYTQHKAIFAQADAAVDVRRFARLDPFPLYRKQLLEYQPVTLLYQDTLRLDFTSGFAFLQGRGYHVKGIFGTATSSGRHTLTFYAPDGRVIITRELSSGALTLDVWGAAYVDISGDGSPLTILPSVKKSTAA